jgi:hypothetical protein
MIVAFGGNFFQILLAVTKGSRVQIVASCFHSFYLWGNIHILTLKMNMQFISTTKENVHFANWLIEVGDGKNILEKMKPLNCTCP